MLESMLSGLSVLLEPGMMLYVLVATVLGLIFGILPGLQGMTLMAIFINKHLGYIFSKDL